ncbi:MAG: hypothetical protein HY060_07965 [Proteobacteria bacterium]|nr:hypothetical protein [Pseudomonadota bacterium]
MTSSFLTVGGPQVHLVSAATAISQINTTVQQLTAGNLSLAQEGLLEQQLAKQIAAANPSANLGQVAVIALDLRDSGGAAVQISTDLQALYRMVQPTTGFSGLTSTVGTIANLLKATSTTSTASTTATSSSVNTILSATALAGASTVSVTSTTGLSVGNSVQIQLDTGEYFYSAINGIANNTLTLATTLPSQATNGNKLTGLPNATTYFTTLNATALTGDSTVTLTSAGGMSIGDSLQILLDSGSLFTTTITGVTIATNTVTLAGVMPSQATSGNNAAALANPFTSVNQTGALNLGAGGVIISYFALLTADALIGATTIALDTVGGMAAGDSVSITLDTGSTFTTTISSVSSAASTVNIVQPLSSQASTGKSFVDNVQLLASSAAFTPSTQMLQALALQLSTMLSAANPMIDLKTLQKDIAALSDSSLTTLQFQTALATLNTLWQTGLKHTTTISVLA